MYFQSSGYMATPLLLTVIATIRIPINKITFSLSWDLKKMGIRTCQNVTKLESCSKLLKYIDRKNIGPYFSHKIHIFNMCRTQMCYSELWQKTQCLLYLHSYPLLPTRCDATKEHRLRNMDFDSYIYPDWKYISNSS